MDTWKITPHEFSLAVRALEKCIFEEYNVKDGKNIDINSFKETMAENSPVLLQKARLWYWEELRFESRPLMFWEALEYIPDGTPARDAARLLRLMPLEERIDWLDENEIKVCSICNQAFTDGYLYDHKYYCTKPCPESVYPGKDYDKSDMCYRNNWRGRNDICDIVNKENLLCR